MAALKGPLRLPFLCPFVNLRQKARDPADGFWSSGQSEDGGVCGWAWLVCVAVKMSMDRVFVFSIKARQHGGFHNNWWLGGR